MLEKNASRYEYLLANKAKELRAHGDDKGADAVERQVKILRHTRVPRLIGGAVGGIVGGMGHRTLADALIHSALGVALGSTAGHVLGYGDFRLNEHKKTASGFTNEYDGDGNIVNTTSREQELSDIFSHDGSFGFGSYDQAKMSSMRQELFEIAKVSMPLKLMANIAKSRGVDPKCMGALTQAARKDLTPQRRHEIAHGIVEYLKSVPKVPA